MRISLSTTLLALTLAAPSALAQDEGGPWYAQLGFAAVGVTEADQVPSGPVEWEAGYGFSAAIGRDLFTTRALDFAIELESVYAAFEADERDLLAVPSAISEEAATLSWMVNGIADIGLAQSLDLYVGLGVGFASEIDLDPFDDGNLDQVDKDGTAVQFKLGLEYDFGGQRSLLIGYRYFQTEDVQIRNVVTQNSFDVEVAQHMFELGFRWGL